MATDDHMRTTLSFVDQSETVEKEGGGREKGACIVVYTQCRCCLSLFSQSVASRELNSLGREGLVGDHFPLVVSVVVR